MVGQEDWGWLIVLGFSILFGLLSCVVFFVFPVQYWFRERYRVGGTGIAMVSMVFTFLVVSAALVLCYYVLWHPQLPENWEGLVAVACMFASGFATYKLSEYVEGRYRGYSSMRSEAEILERVRAAERESRDDFLRKHGPEAYRSRFVDELSEEDFNLEMARRDKIRNSDNEPTE